MKANYKLPEEFITMILLIYNTKLNVFPSNIIGKIFNFKEGELFELEDRKIEGDNIKVDM